MSQVTNAPVVSFEDEPLILVDQSDQECGFETKATCHDGEGILHRAFSVFLFNDAGELLMQRRSQEKRLWPMFWSNSCCSHPRRGEGTPAAAQRRCEQELGLRGDLSYLYKFEYHARFMDRGSEHELCWVFAGRARGEVTVNPNEISEWKWMAVGELDRELEEQPNLYTPWLKMEWARLRGDLWPAVEKLRASK